MTPLYDETVVMKQIRNIIEIDEDLCDGCGNCVLACAEGAIQIIDGKARVIADKYCDGLGACMGDCPQDALRIVERPADAFDEDAVQEMLEARKPQGSRTIGAGTGCPSAALQTFSQETAVPAGTAKEIGSGIGPAPANQDAGDVAGQGSALTHWPVQIRLIPPGAFFLDNSDVLVTADCVPVAYPHFHRDFLQDKAVMIGCPKFDDTQAYVEKLSQVFAQSRIRSITAVIMEVPCCSGLPMIIKKALEKSGKNIPLTKVVISTRGHIMPSAANGVKAGALGIGMLG